MPNKPVHDICTLFLAEHAVLVHFAFQVPPDHIVPLVIGCLSGIPISPDLDMADRKSRGLWSVYWLPYGLAFPHRHPITHFPILSTAVRLIYLLPIFVIAGMLWSLLSYFDPSWGQIDWASVKYWAIGLAMTDTLHFVLDMTTTWFKRRI